MYDVYARIKKRLQGERYGIYELSKPIAAILANILYDKRTNRKKLKRARKLLLSTPRYTMAADLVGNVFTWTVERDDHRRSAEDIQRISEYQEQRFHFVRIPNLSEDTYKKLDISALWFAARIAWRSRETPINRFFVFCAASYAIKHFKAIDEKGLTKKITRLVAYNSSNAPECFLTTACRAHGVATFSLQHGFYYDHGQKPPLAVINYENVTAQYLLIWSEFCREQISAFHHRQGIDMEFEMLTAGYLKHGTARPTPAVAAEASVRPHLLCLLPGPKDEQGCVELLELLSELPEDYRITVRMHPFMRESKRLLDVLPRQATLDEDSYLADTLSAQRFTAAVGFNTTSLFETLIVQVPCAIFLASTNSFRTPEIPEFQTAEELIDLLDNPTSSAALGDYLLGSETFRYPEIIGAPIPAAHLVGEGELLNECGERRIP
ncbi:hypothetical protein [Stutzerimonas azotifigens]|uniref:Surface carbohydrate biosynthesis protein n=1 Tax=Stutzerimonas azotifigens TaxID=291995 RepID=A0ABR5Z056_9GAMM|nr:hypothetical protein [Stutzerimonas azotifigens]MBA1273554.1 hypothetical protein [Stutzerimonas azotifigens]